MNVELREIYKTFGTIQANDGISLVIPGGMIQGVLGENGAGKSTLMKILSGFIEADRGAILLDGKPVKIHSPADAIRAGVGMLHQDPLDFPPMRVIDNFIIGQKGTLFPNYRSIKNEFLDLQNQFGFSLDPDAYVDMLTVGERQQLEILRLLWLGVRVLILDEPTTGISALQKEKLFATLRRLAAEGKTVIFVSHKLDEVQELCHRVVVLRKGKLVGEAEAPYNVEHLIAMMFGRAVMLEERRCLASSRVVLELDQLVVEDYRLRVSTGNLRICAGEVVGLAGMEGSGQELFLRACAGLVKPVSGKIKINSEDLTGKSYLAYKEHHVGYLPAARLEEGLVPGLSLSDHFILAEKQRGLLIDRNYARSLTEERIAEFSIRGTPASMVEALSGGNQQRALLALLRMPLSLLLLEHPTRGLDVESSIYIWKKLKARCENGTPILFISSDLEEILQYSDRVLVFFSGKMSPLLDAAAVTVDVLGQLIGGSGWSEILAT